MPRLAPGTSSENKYWEHAHARANLRALLQQSRQEQTRTLLLLLLLLLLLQTVIMLKHLGKRVGAPRCCGLAQWSHFSPLPHSFMYVFAVFLCPPPPRSPRACESRCVAVPPALDEEGLSAPLLAFPGTRTPARLALAAELSSRFAFDGDKKIKAA